MLKFIKNYFVSFEKRFFSENLYRFYNFRNLQKSCEQFEFNF